MPTVLSIEQGGTGVQTVSDLKTLLALGSGSGLNTSDDYHETSHEKIPTCFALNEAFSYLNDKQNEILPISHGGTGASTPEQARINLGLVSEDGTSTGGVGGISVPVSVANGGTGATTDSMARRNLGINFPLPISDGGTGATSIEGILTALGITLPVPITIGGTGATTAVDAIKNLIGFPVPLTSGGTGANNPFDARKNLGFNFPLEISDGGTGGKTLSEAQKNLGITNITVSAADPTFGNEGDVWIKYKS